MATNKVQFIVEAIDQATATFDKVEKKLGGVSKAAKDNSEGFKALGIGAGVAFTGIAAVVASATQENNKFESSLAGLKSIVKGTGNDFTKAQAFVQDFTKDGLITAAEASTSLKNLLAKGFNLKEASDLMMRFKDAAAFGRQAALSMGEAVQGATEGIKNENSALVDNAGVTKNVAAMQEDYAKSIGKSYKDLTELEKRTAVYNGVMKETSLQVGDAAKASETLSGKQAKLNAQTLQLKQSIGAALAPAITSVINAITPLIISATTWIQQNPQLAGTILIVAAAVTGLIAALVALGFIIGPISAAITAIGAVIAAIGAPILLIIAAVGALAYAFYTDFGGIRTKTVEIFTAVKDFLVSTWTSIKGAMETALSFMKSLWQSVWNGMKAILQGVLTAIGIALGLAFQLITGDFSGFLKNLAAVWKLVWTGIKTVLQTTWQAIQSFLSTTWNAIKMLSESVWNGIKMSIQSIVNAIGFFFTSEGRNAIYNGATGMFRGIAEFVSSIFNGIVNSIQGAINTVISSINWAISQANKVPGVSFGTIAPVSIAGARAEGGPVNSGSAYLVGERGPELFMPGRSGAIIPNNRLSSGGMSGGITINLGGVVVNSGADENRLVDKIKRTIYQEFYLAKLG